MSAVVSQITGVSIACSRADSRLAPRQWETQLQSNAVSHWLGANLESALLLNRLCRRRSNQTSELRDTGLCEGNPPVTGGFPSQRASNKENVSIWWRHHELTESGHQNKAQQTRISHYNDDIMSALASQITRFTIVYSTVYSGTNQRKHQSSASLAFVRGIHRWPVNSRTKGQ